MTVRKSFKRCSNRHWNSPNIDRVLHILVDDLEFCVSCVTKWLRQISHTYGSIALDYVQKKTWRTDLTMILVNIFCPSSVESDCRSTSETNHSNSSPSPTQNKIQNQWRRAHIMDIRFDSTVSPTILTTGQVYLLDTLLIRLVHQENDKASRNPHTLFNNIPDRGWCLFVVDDFVFGSITNPIKSHDDTAPEWLHC